MSERLRYQLEPRKIVETIEQLQHRIEERFPKSGLATVCARFATIAKVAEKRAKWVGAPILALRLAIWALILLIVLGLGATGYSFFSNLRNPETETISITDLIQTIESGIQEVVLVGAGVFFLMTLESRIKRRRALKDIHALRSIAHVIDMHQLTKDPERFLSDWQETSSSPKRTLTRFQLSRYLDYCCEMLALCGKVAALYVQDFDDSVTLSAASEVEALTTGLSRKIWQKINILHQLPGGMEPSPAKPLATSTAASASSPPSVSSPEATTTAVD